MESSILYIACMFLGGVGAWLVARWGSGFDLLDKANHRSSHKGVVPKGAELVFWPLFYWHRGCWGFRYYSGCVRG